MAFDTSTGATAGDVTFQTAASGTAGNAITYATRMTIKQGGKVGIGTTTPGEKLEVAGTIECIALVETSDARLKKNIKDIVGSSTAKLLNLRPSKWDWIDESKGSKIGFVAQDLELVIPEAVVTHPALYSGEVVIKAEKKGIVPTAILTHLVKGFQELEARITELEKK